MQTQSRLIMNPNGGVTGYEPAATDEQHEAVLRELAHGHELTAHLQAEALRALHGQGQTEATAALILQEMSRAFTVCINIMGGSAPAATPTTPPPDAAAVVVTGAASARRPRDDGVPRKVTVTSSPYSDGYQWRKYGQKRIMRTSFPRCYYRCCYHRERSCPATKLVQQQPPQQHSDGDQTMYTVTYVHEHTCHNMAPAEPEAAARSSTPDPLGFSAGMQPRQQQRGGAGLDRGSKEELERQALVSSLACVLQGHHQSYTGSGAGTPDGSPSQGRVGDGPSASGLSLDTSDDLGLDVMDYGVTDALYFAASSSYGPGGDGMIP
ncbi:WRKY DNA-binding transcription factor 70-like [Triticum dicoccoides]|uniref:WRKY DNA-binding transcription factor 70-like n=1 Tax=Triticum dicoccoides TaxID=85692 RepID=UPI00162DB523|nr:WRKY DNA-binding transcription factor 70-like [Triticum dicoccoides]